MMKLSLIICSLCFITVNIFAANNNAGRIMSLRILKSTNGKTYAVISTSSGNVPVPGTQNYVGGDCYQVGGNTCIEMPTDPTEMSLLWASLERAFHDSNTELHWVSAHIEHILPKPAGVPDGSPQEVLDLWYLKSNQ